MPKLRQDDGHQIKALFQRAGFISSRSLIHTLSRVVCPDFVDIGHQCLYLKFDYLLNVIFEKI